MTTRVRLCGLKRTPVFFGLFERVEWVEETFDCWNDAVGYAYNIAGFKDHSEFAVDEVHKEYAP